MKKFLSILLTLSLLSSTLLFSCEDKNKSKEPKQPEGNEQDEELNKEKAILENVVFLMNEDVNGENDKDVINKFFGDFMIDGFVQSSEASLISRIYKIDNILVTEYKDGDTIYEAVKNDVLYVMYKPKKSSSVSLEKYEKENEWPLNIFDVFGFDMSNVYSNDAESSDDVLPKVTYDDLTLSEDHTTVTFSDDYLKAIAKNTVEAFDSFTNDEKEDFMDGILVNCAFTVPDQTFTFNFEATFEGYGDLTADITISFKDNKLCDYIGNVSITTEVEGIPVTMTMVTSQNDTVYDVDNNVVSANLMIRQIQECEYLVDGITVDYSLTSDCYFSFVCENSAPKVYMLEETKESMSHTGASKTSTSSKELIVENSTLRYTETADGKVVERVTSDHVSLTTPENVTIPKNVYAAIRK